MFQCFTQLYNQMKQLTSVWDVKNQIKQATGMATYLYSVYHPECDVAKIQ